MDVIDRLINIRIERSEKIAATAVLIFSRFTEPSEQPEGAAVMQ